jgi:tetratricopeptide (TPR) repeat protein
MRTARLLAPAAIVLAGGLAYSSAFPGAFVFDDAPNVSRNRKLDSLSDFLPGRSGWSAQPNRALTFATFAVDRAVAGNDPTFHRAVNVGIHLAGALLVLALVMAAFRAPRLRASAIAPQAWAVGLTAGLLFVAHPIQTQAVTYVVQRLASLATLFYLLSAVLYLRWRNARADGAVGPAAPLAYAGSLAAALLAMRSKEIAFTLPVALLLLESVLFDGPWKRRILGLVPFAAVMALIPATLLLATAPPGVLQQNVVEPMRVQTDMARLDYLLTQFTVIARYLGLLVLPVGQTVDHDVAVRTSPADPIVLASAALLLAIAVAAAGLLLATSPRRARPLDPAARLAALGIAWFFLALSVESSVIPIVDLMNEHRVYLPFAGLAISAATFLALAARRVAPDRTAAITAVLGFLLAAVLGPATWKRNQAWASEVALWTDAVEKAPRKARPRHNLGVALHAVGRRAEAMTLLQEAVRLDPGYAQGHESLGVALGDAGRPAEAEAHFRRAIELDSRSPGPWYDLGTLYFEAGRYAEALPLLEQAIARQPDHPDAYANLGASWNGLGRPAEAVRVLQEAREVIRSHPLARAQLALALAQLGDLGAARREAEAIRTLSPGVAARVQGYIDSITKPPSR